MDGLSGAAGVFAVFSVAIQFADGIRKLYGYLNNINDAPSDLQKQYLELGLLSDVLAEKRLDAQEIELDGNLADAFTKCQSIIEELFNVFKGLESGLDSKRKVVARKWGAIKVVQRLSRKKKELEYLRDTFQTAQLLHQLRIDRSRHDRIEQALVTITEHTSTIKAINTTSLGLISSIPGVDHNNQIPDNLAPELALTSVSDSTKRLQTSTKSLASLNPFWTVRRLSTDGLSTTYSPLGNVRIKSQKVLLTMMAPNEDADRKPHDQYETRVCITLSPSAWLSYFGFPQALQLRYIQSCAGVSKWTISTRNLVPDDAPIFRLCSRGDLTGIRNLISKGQASVRDVDKSGRTLLWYAVCSVRPEVFRFLVGNGAEEILPSNHAPRVDHPMEMTMVNWRGSRTKLDDTINVLRAFKNVVDFDAGGCGWKMMTMFAFSYDRRFPTGKGIGELQLLEWLLSFFWTEIRDNFRTQDCKLFLLLLLNWEEAFHKFFEHGPIKDIDAAGPPQDYTLLQQAIMIRCNYSSIWKHQPSLHVVRCDSDFSINPETPLSLAMYSARAFKHWQTALEHLHVDLNKFIEQELKQSSPISAAWGESSLRRLLEYRIDSWILDNESDEFLPINHCTDCGIGHWYFPGVKVQPYWLLIVEAIRSGTDASQLQQLQSPTHINSGSVKAYAGNVQPPIRQAGIFGSDCPYETTAITCMNCWLDYQETGMRPNQRRAEGIVIQKSSEDEKYEEDDSEADDDFSPFLVHGSRKLRPRGPLRRCTKPPVDPIIQETIYEHVVERILSGKRTAAGNVIDYF